MNMCHQVLVKACQKQAAAETGHCKLEYRAWNGPRRDGKEHSLRQEMKTVPRRPNTLFMGSVNQQPMMAQHRYGAELVSPRSQASRPPASAIPNWCL